MVVSGFAPVECGDGPALRWLAQVQRAHLLTRLLDVPIHHSSIALGQPAQQYKQQLIVAQCRTATQTLAQLRPALQIKSPIQRLS